MANSRVYHLVCDFCKSEFQAPSQRKTCSDKCRTAQRLERHEEMVSYRRSLIKTCKVCPRVFTWEDKKAVTEDVFDRMLCCSAECHRIYQKKETTERHSILYHGVKLTIEDVCALEQRSPQAIHALMQKKALPGAKWAAPKLRKIASRERTRQVRKDQRDQHVMVRVTEGHLKELQEAAQKSGIPISQWASMRLLECARGQRPHRI